LAPSFPNGARAPKAVHSKRGVVTMVHESAAPARAVGRAAGANGRVRDPGYRALQAAVAVRVHGDDDRVGIDAVERREQAPAKVGRIG